MKLSGERFQSFLKVMEIVGTSCNYLIIEDSKVRQLSSSRRSIFEMNLSPLFEGEIMSFVIPNVVQKFQLLSVLSKQQSEVSLSIDPNKGSYTFQDEVSKITIPNPLIEYVEKANEFLKEEDFNKLITANDPEELLSDSLDKLMMTRLSSFARAMSTTRLYASFMEEGKVFLEINTSGYEDSKTNISVKSYPIDSESKISGKAYFDLEPIVSCLDPLGLSILVQSNKKRCLGHFSTTLLKDPEVILNIWGLSEIKQEQ